MQEIVKDQESGIIIPAKNDELLERNLVYVLGNDQLRKKIGQGGITQSQMFSKEKIIETLIKVLEKITTTL
jgi:glycosyltransferase involved in cell wall biosynthesis